MSPWGFRRRRNQPLARGLLRTHYNGRVIGSSIVATNPHTTDDGFALTLGGGIPRGTREYTFWQGDGTDNIAYARNTTPYVITTGSENQPCTFVCVFKMQTTAASNTSIAGLGAQTGAGGSTLFRLAGGTTASSLYLQVQDGGGTTGYNAQLTTPVAVNDLRWHTAVVTFDMVVGGNARCYVDGVAPSASLNFGAGNFTSNTTFDYVSVCGIIRGGSPLAYGPFDVALFVPMFGAKLSDQEAKDLSSNPWQLFRPVIDPVILAEVSGGATHATTGALTGQGAIVAGTAAHLTLHATSGVLTGQGSTVAGAAAHEAVHATSGALTGQGSIVSGVAVHPHISSGALTGPGSVVSGTAANIAGGAHPTSGDLVGGGAVVAGTATHIVVHATSGALAGPGSIINGTASQQGTHATSGVLVGSGAVINGVARLALDHDTSGALVGPGAVINGIATGPAGEIAPSTPGFTTRAPYILRDTARRAETEEEKTKRRIRQGTIKPPIEPKTLTKEQLAVTPEQAAEDAQRLRGVLEQLLGERKTREPKIAKLEEIDTPKAQAALLRLRQQEQIAAAQEDLLRQEIELNDIIFVAKTVIQMI